MTDEANQSGNKSSLTPGEPTSPAVHVKNSPCNSHFLLNPLSTTTEPFILNTWRIKRQLLKFSSNRHPLQHGFITC